MKRVVVIFEFFFVLLFNWLIFGVNDLMVFFVICNDWLVMYVDECDDVVECVLFWLLWLICVFRVDYLYVCFFV